MFTLSIKIQSINNLSTTIFIVNIMLTVLSLNRPAEHYRRVAAILDSEPPRGSQPQESCSTVFLRTSTVTDIKNGIGSELI